MTILIQKMAQYLPAISITTKMQKKCNLCLTYTHVLFSFCLKILLVIMILHEEQFKATCNAVCQT